MKKEEKNQLIDRLAEKISKADNFYLADIGNLTVENSNKLRRLCFKRNVEIQVVKNTLLKKALERTNKDFSPLHAVLKGDTSIMFAEGANTSAKLIKEFRKTNPKPILKGAYVEESFFFGDDQLDALVNLKSKNELIGDLIGLLQSPSKNVISALLSGQHKLAGIVKTLSDK